MAEDAEGSGVAFLVAGATAICGSYLLRYLYNITAERAVKFKRTPKFFNFGPDLKSFLSSQQDQQAMVLVEGSIQPVDLAVWAASSRASPRVFLSPDEKSRGVGRVILVTEYFKSRVENTDGWQDASRTTEYERTSVPFILKDHSNEGFIEVNTTVDNSIGFDRLLQFVDCATIDHNSAGFDEVLQVIRNKVKTNGVVPISIRIQEYLLLLGTNFGGYGKATLTTGSSADSVKYGGVVTFHPEEVGSSIKDLIDSHEFYLHWFRWLSWVLFLVGGFVIVFFAAPRIWRYLQRRRSARRLVSHCENDVH